MREWWIAASYEILKFSRMRSVLIVLIGLPLVLILLLGSAFDTKITPAEVALYTSDQGELSKEAANFLNSESVQPYIHVAEAESEQQVKNWLRDGKADYGIIIPEDYSEKAMSGDTVSWQTYPGRYEERNIAARAIVDSYMANMRLQLAAYETLSSAASAADAEESASAGSALVRVGNLNAGASDLFKSVSPMQYYSAAYLIMFLLYGGMSAAISLLNQKKSGTLQRLLAVPKSFYTLVAGIIAGAMMLATLQAVVIILFTSYVYGVDWGGRFGWIALICLLTTAAGVGLAITIASIGGTVKTTQTIFGIFAFTMTFLSGGMVADIDSVIGQAGKYTINYWSNASLRTVMNGTDMSGVWSDIGVLACIAFILLVIAAVRLPKVVNRHV